MRNLDHPNLARFYGATFTQISSLRQMVVLTESPKKGFLRDLIDNESLVLNWDLRASLIWDLLRVRNQLNL